MRAIITILTAAVLCAGPAYAQQAQDGPAQVVVVGQGQAELSDRRLERAERYAELMELERVVTEMMQAIGEGYIDSLVELAGGRAPTEVEVMREAMNDAYADVAPVLIDRMVAVYARVYTDEELAALVQFYESPVGRSLIARSREVDRLIALETEDLLPLFEEHFRSRYCARAQCPKLTPTN